MKKKRLAFLLVALLLAGMLLPRISFTAEAATADPLGAFTDLPAQSGWAYNGIAYCVENGYMNGMNDTSFSPSGSLTRGQLVTVLYRISGSPESEYTGRFTDVPSGKYFTASVEWAAENGIVNGKTTTTFAPNDPITREQIAAILFRFCEEPATSGSLDAFPDKTSSSQYSVEALCWAVENGLINGVSVNGVVNLQPKATATRAQIATILMRLMNQVLYEISIEAYEGLDDYMISRRIDTDIDAITAPFENENGDLENDESILTDAGMAVYDWALELIDAGMIESATYNEQGHSVAFFLKDGSTTLYLPNVAECYAGTSSDFSVVSVDSLGAVSDAVITAGSGGGSEEAANTVFTNAPEYTEYQKISRKMTTVNQLKSALGNLAANDTRVIFWRGHAGVYTDDDGTARVALVIDEKKTRTSDAAYYDDLHRGGNAPKTLASSGKHYAVNSLFFDTYLCLVDGGLFYCGSCQSANDGGVMAQILFEKGFDAYCGATVDIFTFFSDQMMCAVAQKLTELDDAGDYTSIAEATSTATTDSGFSFAQVDMKLFEKDETDSFRLVDPIGYKAAYAEVLKKQSSSCTFALTHIDEDDIPELLVYQGSHHSACVDVYTYYNGEAASVGSYPEYGTLVFGYKQNVMLGGYMQHGYVTGAYYKIDNGKQSCLLSYMNNSGSMENTIFYKINDVNVGKTAYDLALKTFEAGYDLMSTSYWAGAKVSTKNINAMIEDISDFLILPE